MPIGTFSAYDPNFRKASSGFTAIQPSKLSAKIAAINKTALKLYNMTRSLKK